MPLKWVFHGGVSAPHRKNTAESETSVLDIPEKVVIPMVQHIGAPCTPTVKPGDTVKVGQKIGDSEAYVSAPIHSSVSGTVTRVEPMLFAGGNLVMSVEIKTDGKQEVYEGISPPEIKNREDFLKAVRSSGLVGLGGAGFPTHVKLNPPKDKVIDCLIVNGAECEPYITSDYREMLENPDGIIEGIKLVLDYLSIPKAIMGIEDNKPKAYKLLKEKAQNDNRISVQSLRSRYPQGAEKTLVYALTGRKIPSGKLPADVGCVVLNVNTVAFIASYVKTGMPLVQRRVTVDGPVVNQPKNVLAPIGTSLQTLFDFCGGFKSTPYKVLMGGPMMGIAQYSLETSVIKNTNAILAFDKKEGDLPSEWPCIRCGRCVEACPMNLLPLEINRLVLANKIDELERYHILDCIECGSCSYSCPSKRHLVQSIRIGKDAVRRLKVNRN
ncbi:electron transport complex protein RnfC [Thermoclostridium stercorarium subsp. stercorarium DSM 8532]|uniref:Ion-translocating oxidoreductase complex subunit C n=3 Tax=Thermoclostridium stercorarium TaxID=1510 RepID=L7VRW4_THES1|nr:electron transport complex subunit RsxC [Thermoclostridium stercorarium]AGC69389.1 electron transport complex protein RnfC [Thermoclostridium stercorarium subsp. stercorarium DSM 8532]AGI40348.1 NfoC [Thermoclostridium stercorarium subsp. stercorarium DSM 8532]ANW99642.1 electron transporter RnfC [Thermoclostridium stercorarium subsp. thermolacticum DSM 2910]ANX02268.1 electron transporter RnfC [Thermoclostridium stercorarium subsp. leptospartum DSM 9219]UZQ85346.1 electron transport comple